MLTEEESAELNRLEKQWCDAVVQTSKEMSYLLDLVKKLHRRNMELEGANRRLQELGGVISEPQSISVETPVVDPKHSNGTEGVPSVQSSVQGESR